MKTRTLTIQLNDELYKREGNASHLFLENRISDCLNTFLTGPLLNRGKRRWRMRENHL